MNRAGSHIFGSTAPLPKPWEGIRAASGDPFGLPTSTPRPTQQPFVPPVRLDDVYKRSARPFGLVDESGGNFPVAESLPARMAKTLQVRETPLVQAYFSKANLDEVQRMLRDVVKRKTGFSIDRQSDDQLLIVMRAIYADHATNMPRNVRAEVARLNRGVIGAVLDGVISGMTAHLAYLRDASRLRQPIPRGAATSSKGLTTTISMFRPL